MGDNIADAMMDDMAGDMMNDTNSIDTDSSSISGQSSECSQCSQSNSICDELDQLLTQLHEIHAHHHNAIETLENIHTLVANSQNMYITHEDLKQDLGDVLESIHQESLTEIRVGFPSQFGQRVLSLLETATLE